MCGIFGIINNNSSDKSNNLENIPTLIITALNFLKNRGYDSCGIYLKNINNDENDFIEKFGADGQYIRNNISITDIFDIMEKKISEISNKNIYNMGIGHTRWATHGGKTDENSHPHFSNDKKTKLVHNGIISNFLELKIKYLENYNFASSTDTEVIANMIQYLKNTSKYNNMEELLAELTNLLEGTWACIISDSDNHDRLYFIKNENPLLIGQNDNITMFTSEPSGFMNKISKYYLLRDKTYGYVDLMGNIKINGKYKELELIILSQDDLKLPSQYKHWMYKEILDQSKLNVLIDPITKKYRYNQSNILFNFDFIKPCKYLYIIACGSSYYAGLIASNYFRYTKAFEFVNVYDGGEFTKAHLEAIQNPESNLLVLLISQSGETRDLNIATTICREFSSNRKNILEPNNLLHKNELYKNFNKFNSEIKDSNQNNIQINQNIINQFKTNIFGEIKIIGIINVIGSLISRRTIDNIYTNCGRENSVASTKSCTSQILACLLLAIYKSELNEKLELDLKNKFLNDLNRLEIDILQIIHSENKIEQIATNILEKNKSNMFLLGKDELHGSALEGALKIKEISYIHAEGFNISALKHGPYAMIEKDTPIIVIYKERDHFVKSIVEEIKTRGAFVIEISSNALNDTNSFILPSNKTFTGLLAVITLQLLSYYLSVKKGINPDRPRNLAKVVTVD
jgi:glucosamine--fructose-6-phosphate aminotransferase (isomerizing)